MSTGLSFSSQTSYFLIPHFPCPIPFYYASLFVEWDFFHGPGTSIRAHSLIPQAIHQYPTFHGELWYLETYTTLTSTLKLTKSLKSQPYPNQSQDYHSLPCGEGDWLCGNARSYQRGFSWPTPWKKWGDASPTLQVEWGVIRITHRLEVPAQEETGVTLPRGMFALPGAAQTKANLCPQASGIC